MWFRSQYSLRVLLSLSFAYVAAIPLTTDQQTNLRARKLLSSSFGATLNQTFDYLVVGGGTAGLAVAARLSENPAVSVAVIEAGSFYEIGNSNFSEVPLFDTWWSGKNADEVNPLVDWGFMTTPQPGFLGQSTHYARGKCLGGSSGRNYMTYHGATKQSMEMWANTVGDNDYLWDNFAKYYVKSTHLTPPDTEARINATTLYNAASSGTNGPLSVTWARYSHAFSTWCEKALTELGLKPINGFMDGSLIGYAYQLLAVDEKKRTRASSETHYLQPALSRDNIYVFPSTMAKNIVFDENKTATGVSVDTMGKKYFLTAKKEVIVSAGAFQSPQILMVSGVGPAALLQEHNIPVVADRPGVGQNMQDHVLGGITYAVDLTTVSSLNDPKFAQEQTDLFLQKGTGMLTDTGSDILGWEKVPESYRQNFSSDVLADLATFPEDWPEIEFLIVNAYFGNLENGVFSPKDGKQYASVAVSVITPMSRGNISISSADTADHPLINPQWLTHPTDKAVLVAAYRRARELFKTKALDPIRVGEEFFPGKELNVETDEEIINFAGKSWNTVSHASSTCSMGKVDDPNAVVDSKGKVIGVNGVRVVDASAFPFLPPGHPMATIYALAEKIADDIKNGS